MANDVEVVGQTRRFADLEVCVEALLQALGPKLKVATPLGLGKPVSLLNALYKSVKEDPTKELLLLTGLSLQTPSAGKGLQRRLVKPILDRLYQGVPTLDYALDMGKGALPKNVCVRSFFLQTGLYKGNLPIQSNYISSNYTHAARDLVEEGLDALVQMVSAPVYKEGKAYYSLSCNPDLTMELLRRLKARGEAPLFVAQVNHQLPIIEGDALVPEERFSMILDEGAPGAALFPLPSPAVEAAQHAIGLHVSALIPDGGTLQIGIGSLGDALVHALLLRHLHPSTYKELLDTLGTTQHNDVASIGGVAPFEKGLYANTEMLVPGMLHLRKYGVLKRDVFDQLTLQRWALKTPRDEEGRVPVTPALLDALHEERSVPEPLTKEAFLSLQGWGVFSSSLVWEGEGEAARLVHPPSEESVSTSLQALRKEAERHDWLLGEALTGGTYVHGGFFLGPTSMYEALRQMSPEERSFLSMTEISRINALRSQRELLRLQRVGCRCCNITMMHTLLGAAVSDGLDNGQVISGVGGQYDFVSMSHELEDGRSILMQPAVRFSHGRWRSNILWNYGHTTIPRHLRDIVVTEYGIAQLRGKTDEACIKAMLEITDAHFQEELRQEAVKAGKLSASYSIPEHARQNVRERLHDTFRAHQEEGWLPLFPLGTELSDEEILLSQALPHLQALTSTWGGRFSLAMRALSMSNPPSQETHAGLSRMGLLAPKSLKEQGLQLLVRLALESYLDEKGYLHQANKRSFPIS